MADENEVQNPYDPEEIRNFDVVGICDRVSRIVYELVESESASVNMMSADDLKRLDAAINALDSYVQAINEEPRLDLPHSYPAMYKIQYITKELNWEGVANRMVRDFCRLLINAQVNWSRSESADLSNGFFPADVERWNRIVSRINSYIEKYVNEATPIDMPESSTYEYDHN